MSRIQERRVDMVISVCLKTKGDLDGYLIDK